MPNLGRIGDDLVDWLAIGTVACVLGAMAFGALTFASLFAFDRPGSESNYKIWGQVIFIRGGLATTIARPIAAWLAYGFKWRRTAAVLIGLPLLWLVACIAALVAVTESCGQELACSAWTAHSSRM